MTGTSICHAGSVPEILAGVKRLMPSLAGGDLERFHQVGLRPSNQRTVVTAWGAGMMGRPNWTGHSHWPLCEKTLARQSKLRGACRHKVAKASPRIGTWMAPRRDERFGGATSPAIRMVPGGDLRDLLRGVGGGRSPDDSQAPIDCREGRAPHGSLPGRAVLSANVNCGRGESAGETCRAPRGSKRQGRISG
jgi:hypothetical protein